MAKPNDLCGLPLVGAEPRAGAGPSCGLPPGVRPHLALPSEEILRSESLLCRTHLSETASICNRRGVGGQPRRPSGAGATCPGPHPPAGASCPHTAAPPSDASLPPADTAPGPPAISAPSPPTLSLPGTQTPARAGAGARRGTDRWTGPPGATTGAKRVERTQPRAQHGLHGGTGVGRDGDRQPPPDAGEGDHRHPPADEHANRSHAVCAPL